MSSAVLFNLKTDFHPESPHRQWQYNTGCDYDGEFIQVLDEEFLGEFHVDEEGILHKGLLEYLQTYSVDVCLRAKYTIRPRLSHHGEDSKYRDMLEFTEKGVKINTSAFYPYALGHKNFRYNEPLGLLSGKIATRISLLKKRKTN